MFSTLALFLALLAPPAPPQAGAVPAPAEQPLSEAEIEAFLASLDNSEFGSKTPFDPRKAWAELESGLRRDNPGRDPEIAAVFQGFHRCASPHLEAAVTQMTHRVVRGMGRARVAALTRLFRGDFQRIRELVDRLNGKTLSPEEAEELRRLAETYPRGVAEPPTFTASAEERRLLDTNTRPCISRMMEELDARGLSLRRSPGGR